MKQKKEIKEIVLLDTYPSSILFDDLKADLEREAGEVSDERVWDELNVYMETWAEDFKEALDAIDVEFSDYTSECNEYVLMGTVGTWRGNMAGGRYLTTLPDLLGAMGNVDYIKVYAKDRRIYIEGSHHDGTHCMELRMRKCDTKDERWERLDEDYFENAHTCTKTVYPMFKKYFNF
jgi:hypothetical protein